MNKKQLIVVLGMALLLSGFMNAFAKDVDNDSSWKTTAGAAAMIEADIKKVTGYNWLEWSKEKKIALMVAMFEFYNLDKNIYSVDNAVDSLDIHYYAAHTKDGEGLADKDAIAYYEAPCLFTFGSIVGDKDSDWGLKSLRKDAAWNIRQEKKDAKR